MKTVILTFTFVLFFIKIEAQESENLQQQNITYKAYYKFVKYVRDSTALRLAVRSRLYEYIISYDKNNDYENTNVMRCNLNMKKAKFLWEKYKTEEDVRDALSEIFIPSQERFYNEAYINVKKLVYTYRDMNDVKIYIPIFTLKSELKYFNDLFLFGKEKHKGNKALKKLDGINVDNLGSLQIQAYQHWRSLNIRY